MAANDDTKLKVTVRDASWGDSTQTNDYSFDGSQTSFADYDYVTVYADGSWCGALNRESTLNVVRCLAAHATGSPVC